MACIYKITNLVNGKFYIGSTKGKLQRRISAHLAKLRYDKHYNIHLQKSWNKYGENNFKFEILENFLFLETLSDKENSIKLREKELELFISLNPDYNFNRVTTRGSLGRILTQEQKDNISKKGKDRKHTLESKEIMRKKALGKIISQEQIDKIRLKTLGKPIFRSRPIEVFNLKNELIAEYSFQGEAAKIMKIRKTSISNCCNNRRKTAGGYIFKFKFKE